jgi:hypothetical protein
VSPTIYFTHHAITVTSKSLEAVLDPPNYNLPRWLQELSPILHLKLRLPVSSAMLMPSTKNLPKRTTPKTTPFHSCSYWLSLYLRCRMSKAVFKRVSLVHNKHLTSFEFKNFFVELRSWRKQHDCTLHSCVRSAGNQFFLVYLIEFNLIPGSFDQVL